MTLQPHQVAHVIHEAVRALQFEQADPTIPVAASWLETSDEAQASAIVGVKGVLDGNTPEQSHESWLAFKVEHGWVWGPVKDEELKQHPLLVPYADLPSDQKLKDDLFVVMARVLSS